MDNLARLEARIKGAAPGEDVSRFVEMRDALLAARLGLTTARQELGKGVVDQYGRPLSLEAFKAQLFMAARERRMRLATHCASCTAPLARWEPREEIALGGALVVICMDCAAGGSQIETPVLIEDAQTAFMQLLVAA